MSDFYNQIDKNQQQVVNEIISESVKSAIFGFLCVIDGVRSINESLENRGSLKLTYINDNAGNEVVLNNPKDDYLHDIYNAE